MGERGETERDRDRKRKIGPHTSIINEENTPTDPYSLI